MCSICDAESSGPIDDPDPEGPIAEVGREEGVITESATADEVDKGGFQADVND